MAARIPAPVAEQYRLFSLYNSPYRAHDEGRAIDLYPEPGAAPSPVAGEVLAVRSVKAPSRPYAEPQDHLIVIDVSAPETLSPLVARVLHVDPGVAPGDRVAVGDELGRTIRSGFFAPWVDDHLHVGFRRPGDDPFRASGSVPVDVDVAVAALEWDGRGTVVDRGETYVVLDRPEHPHPRRGFAGLGDGNGDGVVDGGFPHYEGGGVIGGGATGGSRVPVSLLDRQVGTRTDRTVEWDDRQVLVDGDPVHGLSLFVGRDRAGAKVVCPDRELESGQTVEVVVE